eukprot:TRINITY_DN19367_c0_g1_i2.p1 TRINITY_DN19367_c0_g1~~TRINITY_DN19367_c0_g1_i2.p1  ORF type:complete len:2260 (-),score=513.16 TRINITY_DN19367_c0_g1_i2:204-6482(-)
MSTRAQVLEVIVSVLLGKWPKPIVLDKTKEVPSTRIQYLRKAVFAFPCAISFCIVSTVYLRPGSFNLNAENFHVAELSVSKQLLQSLKFWSICPKSELVKHVIKVQSVVKNKSLLFLQMTYVERESREVLPKTFAKPIDYVENLGSFDEAPVQEADTKEDDENPDKDIRGDFVVMKWNSISQSLIQSALTEETISVEPLLELSPAEQQLVSAYDDEPLFILGRAGTGKTTVILMKMYAKQYAALAMPPQRISEDESEYLLPKQLLCTMSSSLILHFVRLYKKMSEHFKFDGSIHPDWRSLLDDEKSVINPLWTQTVDNDDNIDVDRVTRFMSFVPNNFRMLNRSHFPLFVTFKKLLRMLDGTLEKQFLKDLNDERRGWDMNDFGDVSFPEFDKEFWPHFNQELTRKNNSLLVWREIIGCIKSHPDVFQSKRGYLDETQYLSLCQRRGLQLSDPRAVYSLFLDYQKMSRDMRSFDLADLVFHLHQEIPRDIETNGSKFPWKSFDSIFIDEAQDLFNGSLSLITYLLRKPSGFLAAGDTAQTISASGFRMQSLKDHFFNFYDGREKNKTHYLVENFRTHSRITKLANCVVDLIHFFFPDEIDQLPPEVSPREGPRPVVLPVFQSSSDDEIPAYDSFLQLFTSSELPANFEFGADQAIIVLDERSKRMLREKYGKELSTCLILTIKEAKGQEFNDVLLFDVVSDLKLGSVLRILYKYIVEKELSNVLRKQSLKGSKDLALSEKLFSKKVDNLQVFDSSRHAELANALKHIYVAFTRARERVFMFESSKTSEPFLDVLYSRELVQTGTSMLQVLSELGGSGKSSHEDWKKRGVEFLNRSDYDNAILCFKRANCPEDCKYVEALNVRDKARNVDKYNHEAAKVHFNEAGMKFEEISRLREAAECFMFVSPDKSAAIFEQLRDPVSAGECFLLSGKLDKGIAMLKLSGELWRVLDFFSTCELSKLRMLDVQWLDGCLNEIDEKTEDDHPALRLIKRVAEELWNLDLKKAAEIFSLCPRAVVENLFRELDHYPLLLWHWKTTDKDFFFRFLFETGNFSTLLEEACDSISLGLKLSEQTIDLLTRVCFAELLRIFFWPMFKDIKLHSPDTKKIVQSTKAFFRSFSIVIELVSDSHDSSTLGRLFDAVLLWSEAPFEGVEESESKQDLSEILMKFGEIFADFPLRSTERFVANFMAISLWKQELLTCLHSSDLGNQVMSIQDRISKCFVELSQQASDFQQLIAEFLRSHQVGTRVQDVFALGFFEIHNSPEVFLCRKTRTSRAICFSGKFYSRSSETLWDQTGKFARVLERDYACGLKIKSHSVVMDNSEACKVLRELLSKSVRSIGEDCLSWVKSQVFCIKQAVVRLDSSFLELLEESGIRDPTVLSTCAAFQEFLFSSLAHDQLESFLAHLRVLMDFIRSCGSVSEEDTVLPCLLFLKLFMRSCHFSKEDVPCSKFAAETTVSFFSKILLQRKLFSESVILHCFEHHEIILHSNSRIYDFILVMISMMPCLRSESYDRILASLRWMSEHALRVVQPKNEIHKDLIAGLFHERNVYEFDNIYNVISSTETALEDIVSTVQATEFKVVEKFSKRLNFFDPIILQKKFKWRDSAMKIIHEYNNMAVLRNYAWALYKIEVLNRLVEALADFQNSNICSSLEALHRFLHTYVDIDHNFHVPWDMSLILSAVELISIRYVFVHFALRGQGELTIFRSLFNQQLQWSSTATVVDSNLFTQSTFVGKLVNRLLLIFRKSSHWRKKDENNNLQFKMRILRLVFSLQQGFSYVDLVNSENLAKVAASVDTLVFNNSIQSTGGLRQMIKLVQKHSNFFDDMETVTRSKILDSGIVYVNRVVTLKLPSIVGSANQKEDSKHEEKDEVEPEDGEENSRKKETLWQNSAKDIQDLSCLGGAECVCAKKLGPKVRASLLSWLNSIRKNDVSPEALFLKRLDAIASSKNSTPNEIALCGLLKTLRKGLFCLQNLKQSLIPLRDISRNVIEKLAHEDFKKSGSKKLGKKNIEEYYESKQRTTEDHCKKFVELLLSNHLAELLEAEADSISTWNSSEVLRWCEAMRVITCLFTGFFCSRCIVCFNRHFILDGSHQAL